MVFKIKGSYKGEGVKIKDLAIDHDYYCSESNYYSNDPGDTWDSWPEFYDEYIDGDIDMNLIFRWDIHKHEKSDRYWMEVFIIHQRKGIFAAHKISIVIDEDVESILELLQKHINKLKKIWMPII